MMRPACSRRSSLIAFLGCCLALGLAGCANVAFEHGASRLEERSLVFGRIVLVRDGEQAVLSPMSTSIVLRDLESGDEPRLITQSFEPDGRFYWAVPPGRYQLSISLSASAGGLRSYAFVVPRTGEAYYFGDLSFSGRKRFDTLGGANIRDAVARIDDDFDRAKAELVRRNPQLAGGPVHRLLVGDMNRAETRGGVYGEAMEAGPACCSRLSELKYEKLPLNETRSFALGQSSALFDFPAGRSRFLAWELPRAAAPYTVALRSVVLPSGVPGRFYVFSPAVMLLDAEFKPIAVPDGGRFMSVPAALLPPRAASLQGEIRIADANASARYLILYTTRSLLQGSWLTSTPGAMAVPGGAIPTGMANPALMEPSIAGKIEVTLRAP